MSQYIYLFYLFPYVIILIPIQYYLFIYIDWCHNLLGLEALTIRNLYRLLIKTPSLHYIYLFVYGQFKVSK